MEARAALDRDYAEVLEIFDGPLFPPDEEDEEQRFVLFGRATRYAEAFTRGFWGTRSLMNGNPLVEEQRVALQDVSEIFRSLAVHLKLVTSTSEPSLDELVSRGYEADRQISTTLHAELTAWSADRARSYDPVAAVAFFAKLATTDERTRWNESLLSDAHDLLVRAAEVALGFGRDSGSCF